MVVFALGSPSYEKSLLLNFVYLSHLRASKHRAWDIFLNNTAAFNEEAGEVALSVLSRQLNGDTNSMDVSHVDNVFRLCQQLKTWTDDLKLVFGTDKSGLLGHTLVKDNSDEVAAVRAVLVQQVTLLGKDKFVPYPKLMKLEKGFVYEDGAHMESVSLGDWLRGDFYTGKFTQERVRERLLLAFASLLRTTLKEKLSESNLLFLLGRSSCLDASEAEDKAEFWSSLGGVEAVDVGDALVCRELLRLDDSSGDLGEEEASNLSASSSSGFVGECAVEQSCSSPTAAADRLGSAGVGSTGSATVSESLAAPSSGSGSTGVPVPARRGRTGVFSPFFSANVGVCGCVQ